MFSSEALLLESHIGILVLLGWWMDLKTWLRGVAYCDMIAVVMSLYFFFSLGCVPHSCVEAGRDLSVLYLLNVIYYDQ